MKIKYYSYNFYYILRKKGTNAVTEAVIFVYSLKHAHQYFKGKY